MTPDPTPQGTPAESSEGRFRRATVEWGHLLEGGVLAGSLWKDRLGGTVQVAFLSLAGPTLSAVVTVARHQDGGVPDATGPLLSYPLSEFCAYDSLPGGSHAYRFSRVLPRSDLKGR